MNKCFLKMFDNILCSLSERDVPCTGRKYGAQYRELLDNISIKLLIDSLEDVKIIEALLKLSTLERVIIVFHFILNFDLNEISVVVHATPDSVYAQKSKAIKKMRSILNAE